MQNNPEGDTKEIPRDRDNNYIPQYLENVITCPCPWQLLPAHKSCITVTINGRDGVSNPHLPHDCLLNHLFRCRWKKTLKLRVTGFCAGNSPVTGEFPAQMASYAESCIYVTRYTIYGAQDSDPGALACSLFHPRAIHLHASGQCQSSHDLSPGWYGVGRIYITITFGQTMIQTTVLTKVKRRVIVLILAISRSWTPQNNIIIFVYNVNIGFDINKQF